MKVLILTSLDYIPFITRAILPFQSGDNLIYVATGRIDDWTVARGMTDYEVGISFMYTRKIPASEVKSRKWYNFHPGPLPEYRGRNLCYHAIMNGEKEFGASLHYMDENFDTGPIINVWRFDIKYDEDAESVSNTTIQVAKEMFRTYLPMILSDHPFVTTLNTGGAYYKKESINDIVPLTSGQKEMIRAIYFPPYYPKIKIGSQTYKIVREE